MPAPYLFNALSNLVYCTITLSFFISCGHSSQSPLDSPPSYELDMMRVIDESTLDQGAPFQEESMKRLGPCTAYQTVYEEYTLHTHILPEASGLAYSLISPRSLWSHNDSGSETYIYALSDRGDYLGAINLNRVSEDIEDLDIAQCPHIERSCIWLGDTGDNALSRDTLTLWIIPEPPSSLPFDTIEIATEASQQQRLAVHFTLEDGPADIEALVVANNGYTAWLFEKTDRPQSRVWELSLEFDLTTDDSIPVARVITTFPAPGIPIEHGRKITAADLNSTGEFLVIRVYTGIYEYAFSTPYAMEELADLEPRLITLGPLSELQGEALTYGWQDQGVWSISESPDYPQGLHYFPCVSP